MTRYLPTTHKTPSPRQKKKTGHQTGLKKKRAPFLPAKPEPQTLIVGTCTYLNRLAEVVLTSTHNLCSGSKIRFSCIPLYSQVLAYKSGV